MSVHRRRPVFVALVGLVVAWLIAVGGYIAFKHSKVTAEKVAAYLRSMDLSTLSGEARAKALRDLARKMNALSPEERRRARFEGEWERWFAAMTGAEKGAFIEATLPSGFKQMLQSFEQLSEEKRRRAIERALKELEKAREEAQGEKGQALPSPPNRAGELSPELQQKVVTIGLKSFYSESSAQTKAELAPLLEEMQHLMESGMLFRGRR